MRLHVCLLLSTVYRECLDLKEEKTELNSWQIESMDSFTPALTTEDVGGDHRR